MLLLTLIDAANTANIVYTVIDGQLFCHIHPSFAQAGSVEWQEQPHAYYWDMGLLMLPVPGSVHPQPVAQRLRLIIQVSAAQAPIQHTVVHGLSTSAVQLSLDAVLDNPSSSAAWQPLTCSGDFNLLALPRNFIPVAHT